MGWYLMAYQHPLCRSGGLAVKTADLVQDVRSRCAFAALSLRFSTMDSDSLAYWWTQAQPRWPAPKVTSIKAR